MITPYRAAILQKRLRSRIPLLGRWLRRGALDELRRERNDPNGAALLASWMVELAGRGEAGGGGGGQEAVEKALGSIEEQAAINLVVSAWAECRHPALAALVKKKGWVASSPPELRVTSALFNRKAQRLIKGGAAVGRALVAACQDDDPKIAQRARETLAKLKGREAVEAVIGAVIEGGEDEGVEEVVLAAGFEPADPHQKALFLFVTGQWAAYEDLDFDHRLLRATFATAQPAVRRRVTEALRRAGRPELLTVLSRQDDASRLVAMSPAEADGVVRLLAENREWEQLWALATEAPLAQSAAIVRTLRDGGWRPSADDEAATFAELLGPLENIPDGPSDQLVKEFLRDLGTERIRMPGRINDIAFHPALPLLAIAVGSGAKKVAVWDYQKAERAALFSGFEEGLVRIAYTPGGRLVCGTEKGLYLCGEDAEPELLQRRPDDNLRALTGVRGERLVAAWRGGKVQLWDLGGEPAVVTEAEHSFWFRDLCAATDGREEVLGSYKNIALLQLPGLGIVAKGGATTGVKRRTAFTPDGESVVTGGYSGNLLLFRRQGKRYRIDKSAFEESTGKLPALTFGFRDRYRYPKGESQGVLPVPGHDMLVAGWDHGRVQFISWPSGALVTEFDVPGERLTSLDVAPGGGVMATGDSDRSMTLWDLGGLQALSFFSRPLAEATPSQIGAASAIASRVENPQVRAVLAFTRTLLQHKFRFDIEVETPTLAVGEFDIEIE